MIFVTLGTHGQPFARALAIVRPLADHEDLVIQHGNTRVGSPHPAIHWRQFCDYEETQRLIEDSSAVVCHAGIGSIVTILRSGFTPVVIPRERRFGEHVDDHQLQIAKKLEAQSRAVVCWEGVDVAEAVDASRNMTADPGSQSGALLPVLEAAVRALAG